MNAPARYGYESPLHPRKLTQSQNIGICRDGPQAEEPRLNITFPVWPKKQTSLDQSEAFQDQDALFRSPCSLAAE